MSTEIDSYISSLNMKLFALEGKKRRDVLMEVRSHLSERVDAGESPGQAIESFGPAASVAKDYIRVYGYGRRFISILMVLGAGLSILTVPAVYLQNPDETTASLGSLIFLLATVLLIIASSVKGGRPAGMSVGLAACATRFVVLGAFAASGAVILDDGLIGAAVFVATSLLLPLVGFLASTVKPAEKQVEI